MLSRRELLLGVSFIALGGVLEACALPIARSGNLGPTAVIAEPTRVGTPTPAALPKLTVSYGSPVGSFAALWMAKAIGAFDKYGLTVDVQYIETATAVPAIVANNIDAEEVSAAPIITADANGDLDLVLIGSALNHPILGLYAAPDITSADDLRGKIVASDKPDTPTDYAAHLSLSLLGLAPTDVDLRIVGSAAEVTPAMLSGQVPAGVVAPPQSFEVEAKGFHLLQSIFDQPYQNVGIVARKSRLEELGPALVALLSAVRDGIQAWNAQPDVAMQVMDQYANVGDATILQKTYEFYTKTAPFEPTLQPTLPGIMAMMKFLAPSVPKLQGMKAEQFVDTRFLAKVAA
jgi:ABC-type nitrate/sulfonate/bicarbonate transport system substrate-binding protein